MQASMAELLFSEGRCVDAMSNLPHSADGYEVGDYQRISVPLRSGAQARVYVFAD
jgi:hypothetical protein